jgi:hypothetical protein
VTIRAGRAHRCDDCCDELVVQRIDTGVPAQALRHGSLDIPPGGLAVYPRSLGHRSQAGSLQPAPQHLTHLDHVDLPERHRY